MQKNFIFSDTETTGLWEKDFIQIIQSASILTDDSFERIDAQNIESRPLPWVVPQPGAYLVHKKISSLDSNISHYQMMKDIYDTWEKWSDNKQSIFITYNGHQFDEELYRRQFYWNLLPPYITNTNGNGRSDLYFLILLVSYIYPDFIKFNMKNDLPILKLDQILPKIGIDVSDAHDALTDCEFMVHLIKHINSEHSDLVEDFFLQATKASFIDMLSTRNYFGYVQRGPRYRFIYPLTFICQNPESPNKAIFLDLSYPIEDILELEYHELISYIEKPNTESPFKVLAINKSQAVADGEKFDFKFDLTQDELVSRAKKIKENFEFKERIAAACSDIDKPFYPAKDFIEQQVYEGFPSPDDSRLFQEFHKSEDFETKHNIAIRIKDDRYREFAKRILYLHFPDRIDSKIEKNVSELIHKRFNEEGPWPDAAKAYEELISKMETAEGSQKMILEKLQNFFASSNN
jgi:exodeoxyribonuclease-1